MEEQAKEPVKDKKELITGKFYWVKVNGKWLVYQWSGSGWASIWPPKSTEVDDFIDKPLKRPL